MPTIGPLAYAFDSTGLSPANRITNESHSLAAANTRDYHFLVPNYAPFYGNGLTISFTNAQGVTRTLVEAVDYITAFPYVGASRAVAQAVYGGISFLDLTLEGTITFVQYQTIGGEYTLGVPKLTEIMANLVYNPRSTTWEQIASVPTVFPVIDHAWNLVDMVGLTQLVNKLGDVEAAIISSANTTAAGHAANHNNPHLVTKDQVQLGNVPNYAVATVPEAIAGTTGERFITPVNLKAVLDHFGITGNLPPDYTAHFTNTNNPHNVTKSQVGLGNVQNLPVVTSAEVIASAPVAKYLTMEMFLVYLANHGGQLGYPAHGILVSTFCTGTTKMGTYSDGAGGTYTAVIQTNSPDCGFTYPAHGTLLNYFCITNGGGDGPSVLYNKMARRADGVGGFYDELVETNSTYCGYVPPSANGTLLSTFCSGTTKMGHYADGQGGTYDAIITTNSTDCGYVAPVFNPVLTVVGTPNSIGVGYATDIILNATGFAPNTTYHARIMTTPPGGTRAEWIVGGSGVVKYFTTNSNGESSATFSVMNDGSFANGWFTIGADVLTESNVIISTQVIPGMVNFVVNSAVSLTADNLVVAAGAPVTFTVSLLDFIANRNYSIAYHALRNSDNTQTQFYSTNVLTNAYGRATSYYPTAGLDASLAGVWRYWVVVDGKSSNNVTMNFTA